jgi:hypothetical protein
MPPAKTSIVTAPGYRQGGPGLMIYVFASTGKVLEMRPVPEDKLTNCAFGDGDLCIHDHSRSLTEVNTWFNTRYTFEDCDSGTCSSGAYDVQTVAIHEFGHWLVLDEIPSWKVWDNSCVMYPDHGVDRVLCGYDKAGIQEIYGTN